MKDFIIAKPRQIGKSMFLQNQYLYEFQQEIIKYEKRQKRFKKLKRILDERLS